MASPHRIAGVNGAQLEHYFSRTGNTTEVHLWREASGPCTFCLARGHKVGDFGHTKGKIFNEGQIKGKERNRTP